MKDAEAKKMTAEKAKLLIEDFIRNHLKENECVYPSDVADELGLDYELVREVFCILENEEKICKKGE
jgi:hypothetical protein